MQEIFSGILKHYLDNNVGNCKIMSNKPTEGKRKGNWLDKYLFVNSTMYQAEIKNWCSHSMGGKAMKLYATDEELVQYSHDRFIEQWDGLSQTFKYENVSKVLKPMKHQNFIKQDFEIKPLICYWYPILSTTLAYPIPFFDVKCQGHFSKVSFFSVSLYLRGLLKKDIYTIDIDTPNYDLRLQQIHKIFPSC